MSDDKDPFDALDDPVDGGDETDPFDQLGEYDREGERPDDPDPDGSNARRPLRGSVDTFGPRSDNPVGIRIVPSRPDRHQGQDSGDGDGHRGTAPGGTRDDPFASLSDVPSDEDPFEAFESAGVESVDHDEGVRRGVETQVRRAM